MTVMLLSPSWTDDAATDAVTKGTRHVLALLEAHAESRGPAAAVSVP